MKKQSDPSLSQWLVTLSVPLVVLSVGALFRLLFDHEGRMARIEANCGTPKVVQVEGKGPSLFPDDERKPSLAYPQAPFVSLAYDFAGWLFPGPGTAPSEEKK